MPDQIVEIPIDQIDDKALERDRTSSDAAQFEELWFSILKFGLRQPIEVYTYATPIDVPYALISGARRLGGLPTFAPDNGPAKVCLDPDLHPRTNKPC
jgi:hypothetical protein